MFQEIFLRLSLCFCAVQQWFSRFGEGTFQAPWLVLEGPVCLERAGPTLIELHKKQRVFEGSSINNGLHEVDEGQNHAADEEERDKWPQVVPRHPESIGQAAQPTLLGRVRSAAGGCRCWGTSGRRVIWRTGNNYRIHLHVQGESEQFPCSLTTTQVQES